MAGAGNKSWTINLRIEPQRYERIIAAARQNGEKPHEFMRRAASQRANAVIAGRREPPTSDGAGKKDWTINLRFEPRAYEQIKAAAALVEEKPQEFIRRAATARANATLAGSQPKSPPPPPGASSTQGKRERWIGAAAFVASIAAGVATAILEERTHRAKPRTRR